MHQIEKVLARALLEKYTGNAFFFPIIGAVLAGTQDGIVYGNHPREPGQLYVEHSFGFSQVFGVPDPVFESDLADYLLENKSFSAPKVRLYGSYLPGFLKDDAYAPMRSIRQRFIIEPDAIRRDMAHPAVRQTDATITGIDETNIDEAESTFGVVERFWRSRRDFISNARAVAAMLDGRLVSVCYAAAEADGRAEIDVITLDEYRGRGLARLVASHFMKRCLEQSVSPLWDCYTNNSGSMALARSLGFYAPCRPYLFYTISR